MRLHAILICAVVIPLLSAAPGCAQMSMDSGGSAAAGEKVAPAKAVDSELSLVETQVLGAVKAMPAEKFGFAPSQAIFAASQKTQFATVRTFAQQATHLAQANYFFYSAVSGMKPDRDVSAIAKMTAKEEIVSALAASFEFAHKAVATLTPENAFEAVQIREPGIQTRATLAQFGISHAYDHYGQIVEYLRMNGIVPPASAK